MTDTPIVAPYEDAEDDSAASVSAPAKPRVKAKRKAGARGRKSIITDALWSELQELYEGGNYSQRDLVAYASSRGVNLSQSLIARHAGEQGWVKGSRAEEIRNAVHAEIRGRVGEGISKMLDEHRQMAKVAIGEIYQHFRHAAEQRKAGAVGHLIPAALLRQLVGGLNEAQQMEARAFGFDVRTGRPFAAPDGGGSEKPEDMVVRIMTEDDAKRIQADLEQQLAAPDEA